MKIYTLPLLVLLVVSAFNGSASAHELAASRATLVLRDSQHLAVSFFVDYAGVLHQVLAPQLPFEEFALQHAAMPPQVFAAKVTAAQARLQGGTHLALQDGSVIALTQWAWPDTVAVQQALQRRAMQAAVAPGDHAHTVQTEIRAQAQSAKANDFAAVSLTVAPEFKQMLVVSYQPKQVWVAPGTPSPTIRF